MAFYNELGKWGDHAAVTDAFGKMITYADLDGCADEIGASAAARSLVFAFCKNEIGSVAGYVSFLKNKIVPVLLKADMERELRNDLIEAYQPGYLYVPEGMETEFPKYEAVWKNYGYRLLKTRFGSVNLHKELALLLTTSGSTGSPKLVRQSYENIQANAASIAAYLELDQVERPITTLPMNYTYGLSIINSHLLVGATLLVTDNTVMSREFWEFFRKEKATSFGGVPYTYEMLKKLRFFKMDLSSLRTMTQAGGKLAPELHREFAAYALEHGKRFVVMYGQTEATARMAYLPSEKSLEKYGSMGIAIPGGKLWLKGVDGNEIAEPDVVGELVYEGTNVTLGYAECREDLAKGDERGGVLETGVMAFMDEEGYFYIAGRKKRFLKIFGNRVNLDEMERMLKAEFQELDCACAGVDDRLYIFVTDLARVTAGSIKQFFTRKTGLNPAAFAIKAVDEIPKNEAGKVQYRKLEEYYDGYR